MAFKTEEKSALMDSFAWLFPQLFPAIETALSVIAIGLMDENQNRLVGLLTGKRTDNSDPSFREVTSWKSGGSWREKRLQNRVEKKGSSLSSHCLRCGKS